MNLSGTTLTAATAQNVLTNVTSAIQDIAYQRGSIGANINQLNVGVQRCQHRRGKPDLC